ncbi:hypothetical protein Q3G72_024776 [Acer saccharum]|nr:hypothetical protein Q3G72_024776 [Acer saccharum]
MQSSKQASKRAKKDRIAIRAALKDDDGGLIVSSDDSESSSSPFSSPTSQPHSPPKKKKRGPAKINFIPPMDGKRLKVRFNERGQPVGKTSNRLVSFIGCLVRRMVPITLSTWHKVDNECRERLRVCVKTISEKFQKIRDTQTMPHTTGRGGLARLEDKMVCPSEPDIDAGNLVTDDEVSEPNKDDGNFVSAEEVGLESDGLVDNEELVQATLAIDDMFASGCSNLPPNL